MFYGVSNLSHRFCSIWPIKLTKFNVGKLSITNNLFVSQCELKVQFTDKVWGLIGLKKLPNEYWSEIMINLFSVFLFALLQSCPLSGEVRGMIFYYFFLYMFMWSFVLSFRSIGPYATKLCDFEISTRPNLTLLNWTWLDLTLPESIWLDLKLN